ncbi:MAG: hypothetical protein M1831_006928 [Alyxoria varia]|nr:MAG: hypothetical protein M1831_006928 [Alyxoria varia]
MPQERQAPRSIVVPVMVISLLVLVVAVLTTNFSSIKAASPLFASQSAELEEYGDAGNNGKGENDYIVDLGYSRFQGSLLRNISLVTFRNIPYTAPPTGANRFASPTDPEHKDHLQSDLPDVVCPQAPPAWLSGKPPPSSPKDIPPDDPRTSEACLVADVLLSHAAWKSRGVDKDGLPVMVWIHGGGWVTGWKDNHGAGHGLVYRSADEESPGIILVSVQYRLGMFGWLSGPGVPPNLGLQDQRFALKWVQKHIAAFGGDPDKVTIMGQSAGGSAVLKHLEAYEGDNNRGQAPFQRAIAQSPFLVSETSRPNSTVKEVLKTYNVPTLDALRDLPYPELQAINSQIIGNSFPFGTFTFGITFDESSPVSQPSAKRGGGQHIDSTVPVITSHTSDEGSLFTSPNIETASDYENFITSFVGPPPQPKDSSPPAVHHIASTLYPPDYSGAQGYTSNRQRANLTISDLTVICNARGLLRRRSHSPSPSYYYEFAVPPGIHGQDLYSTFFDFDEGDGKNDGNINAGTDKAVNIPVAYLIQRYLTNFVKTGVPGDADTPAFPPTTGENMVMMRFGKDLDSVGVRSQDEQGVPNLEEKCNFWH